MTRTLNLDTPEFPQHWQTLAEGPLELIIFAPTEIKDGKGHKRPEHAFGYCLKWAGETIFEGNDIVFGGNIYPDSLIAAAETLAFLSVDAGDVDPSWFDGYTQAQIEWRDRHADTCKDLVRRIELGEREDNFKDNP